jgi:hypothetical protein
MRRNTTETPPECHQDTTKAILGRLVTHRRLPCHLARGWGNSVGHRGGESAMRRRDLWVNIAITVALFGVAALGWMLAEAICREIRP